MAFPKPGVNKTGNKAKQPRPGIALHKQLDKVLVIKSIRDNSGNISRVSDQFGTTRHAMKRWCDNDEELGKALSDSRERMLDDLEEHAWNRAEKDTPMSIFLLKTQGKSRGYEMESNTHTQDIAKAAFDFVINKSKNPAEEQDVKD